MTQPPEATAHVRLEEPLERRDVGAQARGPPGGIDDRNTNPNQTQLPLRGHWCAKATLRIS
jgi:hypothetical protein